MSKIRLDLNTLAVDSFEPSAASYAVSAKPSIRYTDCGSCGIACTAIDCPVPSANYSDCGSCGIACTVIDCAA